MTSAEREPHTSSTKEYPKKARILSAFIFVIASVLSFSFAWPFQPYEYLEFTDVPYTACTHEGVTVYAEREIDTPLFSQLLGAKVSSSWIESETGRAESAGQVSIPIADTGREVIESPVLREAPPEPGSYYLYVETTVYGYVGVVPRDTKIVTWSDHPIEITDCGGDPA